MHRTLFLLFFSVMLLLLAACNNENETNQETVEKTITTVETATVKKGDLQVESSIYGNVMPSKQVPVIGQQPGEVTEVKVENGEAVKKDERIATIRTAMGRIGIFAPTDGKVGVSQFPNSIEIYGSKYSWRTYSQSPTVIAGINKINHLICLYDIVFSHHTVCFT